MIILFHTKLTNPLDDIPLLVDNYVDIPVDKCVDILWKTTLPPPVPCLYR